MSAWVSFVYSNRDHRDEQHWDNVLVIRNASDAVIHNLEAKAVMNGQDEIAFTAQVCPPGESYSRWIHPKHRDHQRRAWALLSSCADLAVADKGMRPFTKADRWTLTTLTFTDAFGKRWQYVSGQGVQPL
ncbi:hypothetical protein ACWGJ9_16120 [Curtobacterium citreum]